MVICNGLGCSNTLKAAITQDNCPDKYGCPPNVCPDFTIRRHDTKPEFKVAVEDCDGPIDLDSLILEANMWALAKLKKAITKTDTYFRLADDIGFNQVMMNDIIIMDRVRLPEHMLVTGFDETNKLIRVQRGYNGTIISDWPRGSKMRIFRILNAPATVEMVEQDIQNVDGTTSEDQLTDSMLVYEWTAEDTCLPGCYWMEFKLLKEIEVEEGENPSVSMLAASVTPSFTPSTMSESDFGCKMAAGIEWVRRFPVDGEGFLIKIEDSPTAEL